MAKRKLDISKKQFQDLSDELKRLTKAVDDVIRNMDEHSHEALNVDGYPTVMTFCGKIGDTIAGFLGKSAMQKSKIEVDVKQARDLLNEHRKKAKGQQSGGESSN